MLAALEDADLVCGSRVAPGARVERHQPLRRRVFGWPYLNLARLILREPSYDLFCGFKLWRGPAADAVFARQRVNGWAFDAESTALARRLGFRVREVGIRWRHREDSRLGILPHDKAGARRADPGTPQRQARGASCESPYLRWPVGSRRRSCSTARLNRSGSRSRVVARISLSGSTFSGSRASTDSATR